MHSGVDGGEWATAGGKRARKRALRAEAARGGGKQQQREQTKQKQQQQQQQAGAPPTKLAGKPGQVLRAAGRPLPTQQPLVVVLVGMPGSGKSTFCAALESELAEQRAKAHRLPAGQWVGPVRVSQDDLGGRKPCVALAEAALGLGHSLLIDRCNFDSDQRAHWLKLRRGPSTPPPLLVAINFRTPSAVCKQRVNARVAHPTLGPGRASMQVIDRFQQLLKWPTQGGREGFHHVLELQPTTSTQAVAAETARLLVEQHLAALPPLDPCSANIATGSGGGTADQGHSGRDPAAAAVQNKNAFVDTVGFAQLQATRQAAATGDGGRDARGQWRTLACTMPALARTMSVGA